MIGTIVTVTVDRPLGSFHPKHPDIYYPVNYGYIEGVLAADGEEEPQKESAAPKSTPAIPLTESASKPRRLFLRVPSAEHPMAKKAQNLVSLFEGDFPVFFYDAQTTKYSTESVGIFLSDYVIRELRTLLGDENVILK